MANGNGLSRTEAIIGIIGGILMLLGTVGALIWTTAVKAEEVNHLKTCVITLQGQQKELREIQQVQTVQLSEIRKDISYIQKDLNKIVKMLETGNDIR